MAENSSTKRQKTECDQKSPTKAAAAVEYLRSLPAIRERNQIVFQAAKEGKLEHFSLDLSKMRACVELVKETMNECYPGAGPEAIPFHSRWRHFEVGGIDRVSKMKEAWPSCDDQESCRRLLDLVTVSVLLDAGAGATWKFKEESDGTSNIYNRSEGLGVASFHMFCSGAFSSNPENPYQVDAEGLKALSTETVRTGFQVNDEANKMVGCEGRAQLLQRLAVALESQPEFFTSSSSSILRPGNMADFLLTQIKEDKLSTHSIWKVVMFGFEAIWPSGRLEIDGHNMGDVWPHSAISKEDNDDPGAGLVCFHKLSQWLTYSLMEPLKEELKLEISDLQYMTGLPEYRNGGLFVDLGVLVPKSSKTLTDSHLPDSEMIIEWRALTVCLLDELAAELRKVLDTTEADFPLVKILEGGTWKAGRAIAKKLRPDTCSPPVSIISDGTVF